MRTPKIGITWTLLLAGAVLVAVSFAARSITDDPKADEAAAATAKAQAAHTKEQADVQDARFRLAFGGALMLRKTMRDPDSFQVARVTVTGGDQVACYEYRARNGFGGMDPSRAVLTPAGFWSEQQKGFLGEWASFCTSPGDEDLTEQVAIALQQYRKLHPD